MSEFANVLARTWLATRRLFVQWARPGSGWYWLYGLDLGSSYFEGLAGLYVIWSRTPRGDVVVDVGQGVVRDRLRYHQQALRGIRYPLYVTWAPVAFSFRSGVERFLADSLRPRVGRRYPDVQPVIVNLPW